jgi:PAS domain S-box-containing protein
MTALQTSKLFDTLPRGDSNPRLLRRLRQGILLFYGLTVLVTLSTTAWLARQNYLDTQSEIERQSMALTRSLNEHATRTLVSVEQAMQNLVEDFQRDGGVSHVNETWAHDRLKIKVERTPQIRAIIMIDAQGILRAHGLEFPTRQVDLSDRNYFVYHKSHDDLRLNIWEPLISRTDYKWLIPVTQRINNADKSFGGVILSGVEPDYFLKFYNSLHLERGTRIELIRHDGTLLLNYPLDISSLGSHIENITHDGFSTHPDLGGQDTLNEKKLIAQVSSHDMPITIRVISDPDRIFSRFWVDTRIQFGISIFIFLIMTGMLLLLLRQISNVEHSESRLHLTQFAVDESPDMIIWYDRWGHARYANRTLGEITGFSSSEIQSLRFTDLIGNNDFYWDKLYAEMIIAQRKTIESVLHKKNGYRIRVDLTLSLISDKQHQYLCVSARDITERHAAQLELRQHRDHLQELVEEQTTEIRSMLDANPLAIMLTVDDHIQSVNPAFETLFGYPISGIAGLAESLIHTSTTNYISVRSVIQEHLARGTTYRGQTELKRNDGTPFWAMLFARALQAGAPARGVIYIIEDITVQRAAEQALRQSEQLKRTILDTATDGFALINSTRQFVDVNHALCHKLGIDRQDVIGITPEELWGDLLAKNVFPALDLQNSIPEPTEVSLPVNDGHWRPFLVSSGYVKVSGNQIEHIFAFLTDISQQKEFEKSLLDAKISAEVANNSKSIFLTKMSHELRTPLHAILSFSELGIHKAGNQPLPEIGRYFENILNSGKNLLTLLNDLIDMSKFVSKDMTYERYPHVLSETIKAAIQEVSSLLTYKKLSIELDESKALQDRITYDAKRLSQVIVNVLSNAIRFSPPEGKIHIAFFTESTDSEHASAMVGVTIRDEGPGIPHKRLETIFSTFDQHTQDLTESGPGLGLMVSRRIMRDHGGSIIAENHALGGAAFTIRIPSRL